MSMHTKKIYYHRDGVTYPVDTYTTAGEVGAGHVPVQDGAVTVYAPVVAIGHAAATHIAAQHTGATKRWGKTAGAGVPPSWLWAVRAGSTGTVEYGNACETDAAGNLYVTGVFSGTAAFGSTTLVAGGAYDAFVAKLNSAGVWQWAVKAGSTGSDSAVGMGLDSSGNIYISGVFNNTAVFGPYSITASSLNSAFVAKLNSDGVFQWATKGGGNGQCQSDGLVCSPSGDCYVTGLLQGTGVFGPYSFVCKGDWDGFVAKISSTGVWQWANRMGSVTIGQDRVFGVALDSGENVYISGQFVGSADFGGVTLVSSGNYDAFVAKLNSAGVWQWAVKAGSTGYDNSYGVCADTLGNVYLAGFFDGTVLFGTTSLVSAGNYDVFVAKLSAADGSWLWATRAGGTTSDYAHKVKVSVVTDGVHIAGAFIGTATFGLISLVSSGVTDIFVAKLNSTGGWLWAVKAGGTGDDYLPGLFIESDGSCYVTGYFNGTITFGSNSLVSAGAQDIFIAKLAAA